MKTIKKSTFSENPLVKSMASIGNAIRAARTQSKLRQVDAALMIGISLQTLVDIEAGKATVGIGKITQAADALGVDIFVLPRSLRDQALQRLKGLVKNET